MQSEKIDRRGAMAGMLVAVTRSGWAAADSIRLSEVVAQRPATDAKDATPALIAALRQASAEQRGLLVDGRFSIRHDIPVPGAVKVFGREGRDDGFDLVAPPPSVTGGKHGHLVMEAGKSIDGVVFERLTFRADFDAARYVGSRVVDIVRMSPQAGFVHSNLTFRHCRFIDPVSTCIRASPDMDGRVEGLQVFDCEVDVTVPLDRASHGANLVQCLLEYIDWPGHKTSYGTVAVKGVRVERCRARGVRTLADMKRGTAEFTVVDCRTADLNDCHYSADGAFKGVFARLEGVQRSPLIKAKNFIEVQGEDIEIREFKYQTAVDLGAIAGVMVTPYALPIEGRHVVHQSRRIRVIDGNMSGIGSHAAVRLINASDCEVKGITVDDIKASAVAIENPPDGLTPSNVVVDGIRAGRHRAPAGVFIAPSASGVKIRDVKGFDKTTTGGGRADD